MDCVATANTTPTKECFVVLDSSEVVDFYCAIRGGYHYVSPERNAVARLSQCTVLEERTPLNSDSTNSNLLELQISSADPPSSPMLREGDLRAKHTVMCPDCGQVFHTQPKFFKHLSEVHEATKCSECNIAFPDWQSLNRHQRKVHKNVKREKYMCDECGQLFLYGFTLKVHIVNAHKKFDKALAIMSLSEDCHEEKLPRTLKTNTVQDNVSSLELSSMDYVNFMALPSEMSASEGCMTDNEDDSSIEKNVSSPETSRKSQIDVEPPRVRRVSSNLVTGTDVLVSTSNLNVSRAVSPETTNVSLVVTSTFDLPTTGSLDFTDPQLSDNRLLTCDVLNFDPTLFDAQDLSNDSALDPLQDSGLLKTRQPNKIRNKVITHHRQVQSKISLVGGKVSQGDHSHAKQKLNLLRQQMMEKSQNGAKHSNPAKENRSINIAIPTRTNASSERPILDEVLAMRVKIAKSKQESEETLKMNHLMMGSERSLLTADGKKITISRTPIQCRIGEQQYVMIGYLLYQKLGYTGFQMQCFKCDTPIRNHVIQATHFRMRHQIDCCKICGEDFPNPAKVKQHEIGVHKIDHMQCLSCNIRIASYDKVISHYNQVHESKYTCKPCRMKIKGDKNWTVHQALYHTTDKNFITCSPLQCSNSVIINTLSPEKAANSRKRPNELSFEQKLRPSHLVPASKRQRTHINSKNVSNLVGKSSYGDSLMLETSVTDTTPSPYVKKQSPLNACTKRNSSKESCKDSKQISTRDVTLPNSVQVSKCQEESNVSPPVQSVSSSHRGSMKPHIPSTSSPYRESMQEKHNGKVAKRTSKAAGMSKSNIQPQTISNDATSLSKTVSTIAAEPTVKSVSSQRLIMLHPVSQRYTSTVDQNTAQNIIRLTPSGGATFISSTAKNARPSPVESINSHSLDPLKNLKDITITKISSPVKSTANSSDKRKLVQISTEKINLKSATLSEKHKTLDSTTLAKCVDSVHPDTVTKINLKLVPETLSEIGVTEKPEPTLKMKPKNGCKTATKKRSKSAMKNNSKATTKLTPQILSAIRTETDSIDVDDIIALPKIQLDNEVAHNPSESSRDVPNRCMQLEIMKEETIAKDSLSKVCRVKMERLKSAKLVTSNEENKSKLIEKKTCHSPEQSNKSLDQSSLNYTLESDSNLEKCYVAGQKSKDHLVTNNSITTNEFSEQSIILATSNKKDNSLERNCGESQDLETTAVIESTSTDTSSNLLSYFSEFESRCSPFAICDIRHSKLPTNKTAIVIESKEATVNEEGKSTQVVQSVDTMPKTTDRIEEDMIVKTVVVDRECQSSKHVTMAVNDEVQIGKETVKSINNTEYINIEKQVVELVESQTENTNIQFFEPMNATNSNMGESQLSQCVDKTYRTSASVQNIEDELSHTMVISEESISRPECMVYCIDNEVSHVLNTTKVSPCHADLSIVSNVASVQSIDDELSHFVVADDTCHPGQSKDLFCVPESQQTIDDEMSHILDDADDFTISNDKQNCNKLPEQVSSPFLQEFVKQVVHFGVVSDVQLLPSDENSNIQS